MALTVQQREFLQQKHFAVVATINEDGMPQLTTIWYLLDGDDLVFNTAIGRLKERNLRRDPRLAATILSAGGYEFVTVRGIVRIDEPTGHDTIRALAIRYNGPEVAAEQMRTQFALERRVTIRLATDKVFANGF